jgi:hypothetical protein
VIANRRAWRRRRSDQRYERKVGNAQYGPRSSESARKRPLKRTVARATPRKRMIKAKPRQGGWRHLERCSAVRQRASACLAAPGEHAAHRATGLSSSLADGLSAICAQGLEPPRVYPFLAFVAPTEAAYVRQDAARSSADAAF